jgi:hypothetical protein
MELQVGFKIHTTLKLVGNLVAGNGNLVADNGNLVADNGNLVANGVPCKRQFGSRQTAIW